MKSENYFEDMQIQLLDVYYINHIHIKDGLIV